MEYQKLLSEEEIAKIYVAEGDIVSFFNADGKWCTKNAQGVVSIIENRIENLEKESNAEEVVVEIEDILGGDKTTALDVSNDLLSVL